MAFVEQFYVFMQRHPEEGGQRVSGGTSGSPGTVHLDTNADFFA